MASGFWLLVTCRPAVTVVIVSIFRSTTEFLKDTGQRFQGEELSMIHTA
jgi:hypothetical protein